MTERVLGPTGSRRRKRLLVFLPLAVLAALVLAIGSSASFSPSLSNFEVDGDVSTGQNLGGTGAGVVLPGVDWAAGTGSFANDCNPAAGVPAGDPAGDIFPCSALSFSGTLSCANQPVDNPAEPGSATWVRDALKTGEPTACPSAVSNDPTTFTQGDKENDTGTISTVDGGPTLASTTPWHIVADGVPPNKDDLFDVYTYTKTDTSVTPAQADVVLGMVRTNNNGSSHLDFELNRLPWTNANCASTDNPADKCPKRAEGDILVAYEITQGGSVSTVQFFRWDLPGGIDGGGQGRGTPAASCAGALSGGNPTASCPWEEVTFPASAVVSLLNQNSVPAGPWGSRLPDGTATTTYPTFGFFETYLDFDALGFAFGCPGFAQASVKARTSGSSVDSALADLAGPFPINLNQCGKIIVEKQTIPDGSAGSFTYTGDAAGSIGDGGQIIVDNLPAGTYTSTEGDPSAVGVGFSLTSIVCDDSNSTGDTTTRTATFILAQGETVKCTFTNTARGSILIRKVSTKTGEPLVGGATFTITPPSGAGSAFDVTDGSSPDVNSTAGLICVDGLTPGTGYSVVEKTAPANYIAESSSPVTGITVVAGKTCATRSTSAGSEDAKFRNIPLSKITVSFDSLAGSETTATIACTASGGGSSDGTFASENLPEGTPRVVGNGTSGLTPGTYTCVVLVDP